MWMGAVGLYTIQKPFWYSFGPRLTGFGLCSKYEKGLELLIGTGKCIGLFLISANPLHCFS